MAGLVLGRDATTGKTRDLIMGIYETADIELVGADEQVDQNDYGAANSINMGEASGELLGIHLVTAETGTGAIQTPAGKVLFFHDAVTVAAGDVAITALERTSLCGIVEVAAGDWQSDANGASAYYCDQPIAFPSCSDLYVVWFHEDATSFNDGAGDDETLTLYAFMRLDHMGG